MRALLGISCALLAAPAFAQTAAPTAPAPAEPVAAEIDPADDEAAAPAQSDPTAKSSDIVVSADRIVGQVDAAQAPIATLNEDEIAALGAGSVGELLTRIAPQTGSGRGRGGGFPVVLVNGQRITNFREMRNFPPEAIQRVEILPEEVALRFGFPPDSRVVNLILKKKFRSKAFEANYGMPTLGGFSSWGLESTLIRVDGPARLSLTGTTDDTSPLYDAERGVVQPASSISSVSTDPSIAQSRTLIADSRNFGLNGAWVRGFGKDGMGGTLTLSGAASRADAVAFLGNDLVTLTAPGPGGASAIRTLPGALERETHVTTLQSGAGYATFFGSWQFSATVDAAHIASTARIDRSANSSGLVTAAAAGTLPIFGPLPALPDAGFDRADSTNNSLTSLTTLIGRPLRLPAGWLGATFKAGYAWSGLNSTDTRSTVGATSLKRGNLSFGVNLVVPLTSRREHVGAGIGDLTLNLSAGYDHLSDFGALTDWSAGLTWAPTEQLGLGVSYIVNDAAPSLNQLGDPTSISINRPRYDFLRNETVLITTINGGNPLLRKERQRDLKFSVNWQLPFMANSNIVVEYFKNRSNNVTASFPLLTPQIEAAFAGRVTRDITGRLLSIDQRPVTFAEQTGSRLRWGFNLSGGFGKADAGSGMGGPPPGGRGGAGPGPGGPRPAGAPPRGAGGAGGGGRGGGGGGMGAMFGGGGGPPGRWSLGVFHTVQFSSQVLVAPGGLTLDLLNGDALSASGTPRHSLEFNGGLFYKGLGTFIQGSWNAPTTVKASGLPGTSDLRFGSVTNVNMFLFFDFSQRPKLIKKVPLLKGARLSFRIENLLGSRQRVTDSLGTVPLSYQPDYLDPRGRVITLQLRKLF